MRCSRRRVIANGTLLLALLTGASNAPATGPAAVVRLTVAITSMQEQAYDKFVIVEIPGSDNYFQFATREGGAYIFDVPLRSLTAVQQDRAQAFFAARGIAAVASQATAPRTMESFTIRSYQKSFAADDPGGGAALGIDFLHQVLHHSGEIRIVEGWRPFR